MRISDWSSDVCSSDLEFLAFIEDAELVIHNAAFDVGFLDHELSRLGDHYGRIRDRAQVLDSLEMARQRYPGQRNSLDALCRRLGVDNSHRQQRSEEHTSELQSLMRISYAVFCLKKKNNIHTSR